MIFSSKQLLDFLELVLKEQDKIISLRCFHFISRAYPELDKWGSQLTLPWAYYLRITRTVRECLH